MKTESRWAEGDYDRLPGLAADLTRLKVDVIVTYGTPASQAAKRATSTIPIVMAAIIDPVASGLVTSLARPGGNVTGQSMMSTIPPTQATRLRWDMRRMQLGPWACGFNSWGREAPARSTAPSRQ